jgi:hypothetical protein
VYAPMNARDKMPLEVTPLYFRLQRYSATDTAQPGADPNGTAPAPAQNAPAPAPGQGQQAPADGGQQQAAPPPPTPAPQAR